MENNKIDIYLDNSQSVHDIYSIFDRINPSCNFNFFCIDLDTFNWLPEEIYNFLLMKEYCCILIYTSDEGFPCFTIASCIFYSEKFLNIFLDNLCGLKYYIINDDVEKYELIEYDFNGITGNSIKIDI